MWFPVFLDSSHSMFAKRTWFLPSTQVVLPLPKSHQGWIFYGVGAFAMLGPTVLLTFRSQVLPEALVWFTLSAAAFLLEILSVRREIIKTEARRNLYHITDITQPDE